MGDSVLERGIARLEQEQYVITVEQLSALLNVPIEDILEESRNVGLASLGVEIITDDKLRSKEVEIVFHEYEMYLPKPSLPIYCMTWDCSTM